MEYMIINGFNTSTIPNCVVTDFGEVEAAKPKVSETATLFGVNGNYRVLDGAYESYERTFAFYLPRTVDPSKIVERFQPNDNTLEFSYQLGSIFYADFVSAKYKPQGMHGWKLEIKLSMQPFRYQKNVAPLIFTASGNVNNPGSVYSEPVIEIEGDGDISLTIGRTTMHLTIRRKVTIDCRHKKQNIYNADGAVQNTLRKRGGFFELAIGNNGLVFTGAVRKVTVRPNWRYIL